VTKIKIPYIKVYRDRHGRVRRYFHRRGQPDIALPGAPGSPEFMAAYHAALDSPAKRSSPHAAGTLARLLEDYYSSVEFANLKPRSQRLYHICLDPIAKRDGHRFVRDMPRDKIRKIIEEIGAKRPGMANLTLKCLRTLLKFAIDNGWRNDNPAAGLKQYRLGTRHTWTDAELVAFEAYWPLGTRQRLAYALLLFTDQRVGDVVRMRLQDIVEGRINVVQEKTGTELSIPIHPKLHEAMKAYPTKGMHLIGDQHGRAIKSQSLSELMAKAVAAAGLPRHCVAHGLRKALMRRLAERGASSKELTSVSGHKSLAQVENYTAKADQRKLSSAAMAKLTEDEE
jgi:enterobacteria phage integrase